jgi:ABC-type amino acid transport substrate-binding protein
VKPRDLLRFGTLPLVLLGLGLLFVLLYLLFAPQPPPKPDDTWTRIQNEGIVRIGVDPSSPPFVVDDGQGNLSGIDVELANELADRWGVRVQWVYTGFDGLYDALNGGQFDLVLSALPYNPLKTQDVSFSHAYFNGGPVLIVRGDDNTSSGLESLKGRPVAVELGSNGDAVARKWQRRYALTLRQYNTAIEALEALQRGEAPAAIVDPLTFYEFQRTAAGAGALHWRLVGKPLADENYVIAVRKNAPTLLQEINGALAALSENGQWEMQLKQNLSK